MIESKKYKSWPFFELNKKFLVNFWTAYSKNVMYFQKINSISSHYLEFRIEYRTKKVLIECKSTKCQLEPQKKHTMLFWENTLLNKNLEEQFILYSKKYTNKNTHKNATANISNRFTRFSCLPNFRGGPVDLSCHSAAEFFVELATTTTAAAMQMRHQNRRPHLYLLRSQATQTAAEIHALLHSVRRAHPERQFNSNGARQRLPRPQSQTPVPGR